MADDDDDEDDDEGDDDGDVEAPKIILDRDRDSCC